MSRPPQKIDIDDKGTHYRVSIQHDDDRRLVLTVTDKGVEVTAYYLGNEVLAVFPGMGNSVKLVAVPDSDKLI